jgi:hypothetical protein
LLDDVEWDALGEPLADLGTLPAAHAALTTGVGEIELELVAHRHDLD